MRKVIQVSIASQPRFTDVVALCDDGAIFTGTAQSSGTLAWKQLPPIPQPEIAADEVVMPMTDEVIFICHAQTPTLETQVIFWKNAYPYIYANDFITMRFLHGDLWRRTKQCPWRDASGKIVEV